MRPTGKLHIGHWVGALSNWTRLQDEYTCFFMVADWHALMSEYKSSSNIADTIMDNVADWLAWGIDPKRSVIFVQSRLPVHLELFMALSIITPLGWLYRCPTFKEQIDQLKEKEINTFAFLGYPVLQTADILLYQAHYVPVGEDQLPHLEVAREIVRRFHFLFKSEIFVEPQPLLTPVPRLLGLDGRKMSKSYDNFVALDEEDDMINKKVLSMVTDPQRIKKDDFGRPEVCSVFNYYEVFKPELKEDVRAWCTGARKGCKDCKACLAGLLIDFIGEKRKEKKRLLNEPDYLNQVLNEGAQRAETVACATMARVREAVHL